LTSFTGSIRICASWRSWLSAGGPGRAGSITGRSCSFFGRLLARSLSTPRGHDGLIVTFLGTVVIGKLESTFFGFNFGTVPDDNIWNERDKLLSLLAHVKCVLPERMFGVGIVFQAIRPNEGEVIDKVLFGSILQAFQLFSH
jgi:hypothetical protein